MKIHFMCISRNVRDSELLKLNDVNLEYCKEVKILSVTLETRILGVTLKYFFLMILPHNDTDKKLLDKSVVRLSLLFFARMAVLLKCYQKKSKSVRII